MCYGNWWAGLACLPPHTTLQARTRTRSNTRGRLFQEPLPDSGPNMGCRQTMSRLGGRVAKNRFLGKTLTLSTSATRVLRRSRSTGKERRTDSRDRMLVHSNTASGC